MSQYQTRIKNGHVYIAGEMVLADVIIDDGRIVAMVSPGAAASTVEDVDASGLQVLPGIIDTHAHTREPGYEHKEDFLTASRAAAAGGVTTMIDMPNVEPPTDSVDLLMRKRELGAAKSIVDFGHWVAPTRLDQIQPLADAGAAGFKLFQVSGAYPHDPRLAVNDDGKVLEIMRLIERTGLPLVVHPFNQSLFEQLSREAFAAGKPADAFTFGEVYTTEEIWHTAVNALLNLQRLTGVRLHLVHTHSAGSLRLVREAKSRGQRVTAAIDPKYYHLTREDLARDRGRACPGGFITEDTARMAEIWLSLGDGTLDAIDADHAPHTLEEIAQLDVDAWTAAMGSPQYDWHYSITLTDVAKGHLSLRRAVELLAEGPAKLLGIFPQKGAILPGSDADLVLVDPTARRTLSDDGLYTKVGWTPYRGWEVVGVVVATMVRGCVVSRNREILGESGFGRFVGGRAQ